MAAKEDLVHETSISNGTGNLTLVNVLGKQSFNSAFGTGGTDTFYYFVSNRGAAEWESGTGHLSSSNTLVRDTVINSSNADAAVNFSAGLMDVTCDILSSRQVAGVTSASPPTNPAANDTWYDLDSGLLYQYINDGSSSQWVQVGGSAFAAQTPSGFDTPSNLGLAVSAAGSALTIALKGRDGNDPSSTNPVTIPFRNVTEITGTPTLLTVTAAASLVISSGSTLGVTSSQAFRLWVLGFNDNGTFRLAVRNCSTCSTTACSIYALHDWSIDTTTAEGGAGAADSAGVFYTGTAIATPRAQHVLGFIEWNATGLTAGTWTTTNLNRIQIFGPGVHLPGQPVQGPIFATSSSTTGTTSATYVATTATAAITPTSAANIISIACNFGLDTVGGSAVNAQLSRGNTNATNMLGSAGADWFCAGGQLKGDQTLINTDKPNTTSSQGYYIQIFRSGGANTTALNGGQQWTLTEIMG